MNRNRVLFLCTGNAARSQMAEGLVKAHLGDTWEAISAGTRPVGEVHPLAVQVMDEIGIDISDQRSKSVEAFRDEDLDLVIAVCDDAARNCPIWMGRGRVIHFSFPDPAAVEGSEPERLAAFRQVRDGLRERVLPYLGQVEGLVRGRVMPRFTFDQELNRLRREVMQLEEMVRGILRQAVGALKDRDLEQSRQLIAQDQVINDRRFALEYDALALIATQQPMAGDLRVLAAMIEIATELERIGDYAKGISRISLMIGQEPLAKPLVDIPQMAEKAGDMLARSLDAFHHGDAAQARAIPAEDDEVDALYNKVYRDLLDLIIADPSVIDRATYLLWVAHNLERTADRVTNICERVIFTVTGKLEELGDEAQIGAAEAEEPGPMSGVA